MRARADEHLLRAKDRIDRDYASDLEVRDLAATSHRSPAHFARSFTRAFGVSPGRYLRERRVERAKDLLRRGDHTVTSACMAVGFSSLGSFSSAFKDLVGESPSDYRSRFAGTAPSRIPGCYTMMWTRPDRRKSAVPEKPSGRGAR